MSVEPEDSVGQELAVAAPAFAGVGPIWRLLCAAARRGRGLAAADRAALALSPDGEISESPPAGSEVVLHFAAGAWQIARCAGPRSLLELYLPFCGSTVARPLVVGHLGQSLDGHIATATGDSNFVTGPANLDHLHRMRALADAVVVGAGTVAADDPQLTTRRVPGPSPTRVVIDPQLRLDPGCAVFVDTLSPTLVVCAEQHAQPACAGTGIDYVGVPCPEGRLDLAAAVAALASRGLRALFVEGGGRTVSAFLEAGLLDRLQIAIAPLVTGSGRSALSLPARDRIADCLRPASRVFAMGNDVLFDCDLRSPAGVRDEAEGVGDDRLPRRIS